MNFMNSLDINLQEAM